MESMESKKTEIFVEGKSEELILQTLCNKWGFTQAKHSIANQNSLSQLKTALKTSIKSTNTHKKIWVIIDADVDYQAAWQSIRDILDRSKKYTPPNHLPKNGLILAPVDKNDIIIGVWIMPNNESVGMLEDFMLNHIRDDNELLIESKKIIATLEDKKIHKYKDVHRSKAILHTWLAWHDEPGESINVAVKKSLFEDDQNTLFRDWIEQLFN